MRLKRLSISNYKSIKKPQVIDFDDSAYPLTLVGMNGSGKSNILEAIYLFFNSGRTNNIYGDSNQLSAEYIATFELSDDELANLESVVDHDRKERFLTVEFSLGKPNIHTIKYKPLIISIAAERKRLLELKDAFKIVAKEYLVEIRQTELKMSARGSNSPKRLIEVAEGPTMQFSTHTTRYVQDELSRQITQLDEYCKKYLIEDELHWDGFQYPFNSHRYYGTLSGLENFDFVIRFATKDLSPLEKRHINISALQSDITKLNNKIAALSKRLTEILQEFIAVHNSITQKITSQEDITLSEQETREKEYKSFLGKIANAMFKNCYLLDNERSVIFGLKGDYEQRSYNNRFFNLHNPIESAFFTYCLETSLIDDETKEKKLADFSKERREELRSKFEKFVNDNRPKHDITQYKKLTVDIVEGANGGKGFKLSIIENSGDKVDINETSLGRRWFFSYWFIKNNMRKGDWLLLDEPAAFLHPQAQKELLLDLQEIVREGKMVMFATHSPYMISEKIDSYYHVFISDSGSNLTKNKIDEFEKARDELGALEFSNIVLEGFRIEKNKTYLFVEGDADATCLEKFMSFYEVDMGEYFIFDMKGVGKADIYYNLVKVLNIKRKFIVDDDTLIKPACRIKQIPETEITRVGNGTKERAIEGLFFGNDRKVYFAQSKVSPKRIKNAKSLDVFEARTQEAFKALLKEIGVIS